MTLIIVLEVVRRRCLATRHSMSSLHCCYYYCDCDELHYCSMVVVVVDVRVLSECEGRRRATSTTPARLSLFRLRSRPLPTTLAAVADVVADVVVGVVDNFADIAIVVVAAAVAVAADDEQTVVAAAVVVDTETATAVDVVAVGEEVVVVAHVVTNCHPTTKTIAAVVASSSSS